MGSLVSYIVMTEVREWLVYSLFPMRMMPLSNRTIDEKKDHCLESFHLTEKEKLWI